MHGRDGGARQRFQGEITVGDAVERVGRGAIKAQRLGGHLAVYGKRRAGQRGGTERAFVQSLPGIGKAAPVARQHLDVGHQMMAESHGLRDLQMGIAGHHGAGVLKRLGRQRVLQPAKRPIHVIEVVADIQLEIGRHLVIARARRVQPAGWLADQRLQPRFHIHMHVFERARKRERARLDL